MGIRWADVQVIMWVDLNINSNRLFGSYPSMTRSWPSSTVIPTDL